MFNGMGHKYNIHYNTNCQHTVQDYIHSIHKTNLNTSKEKKLNLITGFTEKKNHFSLTGWYM